MIIIITIVIIIVIIIIIIIIIIIATWGMGRFLACFGLCMAAEEYRLKNQYFSLKKKICSNERQSILFIYFKNWVFVVLVSFTY